jgi:predicted dehydrogenase
VSKPSLHRRKFLKTTAASAAALSALSQLKSVHAAGNDVLKVGLVGCGGRGTGAAEQALKADPNVKLVAMGDAFPDRIEQALRALNQRSELRGKIDVPRERQFSGFDNYKDVIAQCDVVLLCSPPGFRPLQVKEAVEKGKHIFAEKPVAVDAPGVRTVLAACEEAKRKNLSVVSGLCWRYHEGMKQTFAKIHEGAVGDIVTLHCNYLTSVIKNWPRTPGMTEMEYQVRNWYYFTWLSGDFNVEQHIHSLDKMAWAMKDQTPVKAIGMGGRAARPNENYGHIFDHMSTIYEYANGVKCFSFCSQMENTDREVKDYIYGTEGKVDVMAHRITGKTSWSFPRNRPVTNMYQQEHNELFAAIRSGTPINNGEYMCKSTMMAIMGRMACYTGKTVTWEQAFNSRENLAPAQYRWDAAIPVPTVARPGVTELL